MRLPCPPLALSRKGGAGGGEVTRWGLFLRRGVQSIYSQGPLLDDWIPIMWMGRLLSRLARSNEPGSITNRSGDDIPIIESSTEAILSGKLLMTTICVMVSDERRLRLSVCYGFIFLGLHGVHINVEKRSAVMKTFHPSFMSCQT